MDKAKLISDTYDSINIISEKICEFDQNLDKKIYSYRHLLIMKRLWLLEFISWLQSDIAKIDDLISSVNTKTNQETERLLRQIS